MSTMYVDIVREKNTCSSRRDAYHYDAAKRGAARVGGDIGIIIGSDKMNVHEAKSSVP